MPRKRRKGRLYLKGGRYYGDFRDLGGKLEALIPPGERYATTDHDIATALAVERVKELEAIKRGIALLGRGREELLGRYAQHHLEQKAKLHEATDNTIGIVQHHLERAVEFFGSGRPLTAIDVRAVQEWATWLRTQGRGRRGNVTLSDGTIRHHLNTLSNLYQRASDERKVPPNYNPVAGWRRKPRGRPGEARWLEVHEAALLLEACRTYQPEREDVAMDLHAIVATFVLTGGRAGEVLGLARDDVHFGRRTVTFREHPWRRLKTETSRRELLFPSEHRRVRGRERMITDIRGALDAVAEAAGWKAEEIRTKIFRHTYCAARLQTLDRGAPVSVYTVSRELGHGGESLVKRVYGHLGDVRHRSEVVEYRPDVVKQIEDRQVRKAFAERFRRVRALRVVA
jgi:integrase